MATTSAGARIVHRPRRSGSTNQTTSCSHQQVTEIQCTTSRTSDQIALTHMRALLPFGGLME